MTRRPQIPRSLASTALVLAIAVVFSATVREILTVAPLYEANVDALLNRLAERLERSGHRGRIVAERGARGGAGRAAHFGFLA